MSKENACILVINPGSTSTKVAIFKGGKAVHHQIIEHPKDQLARFDLAVEQYDLRRQGIENWLDAVPSSDRAFDAVSGRGAPVKPMEGGTYSISKQLLEDVRTSRYANHASNLGALLADFFAKKFGVPAYITDPVTVDNFTDVARISGLPEIERKCRSHALNIKAVSRAEAKKMDKKLDEVNFIVAHMGGGISVAALEMGQIVDTNDALLGMGPFSPDRAGALPVGPLVELCFSGKYQKKQFLDILSKKSGLMAYLGEADLRRVEIMIDKGDKKATLVFTAMCYQISKEIGAVAAVLKGNVDRIILTGGMAHSQRLVNTISDHVRFIAPISVVAGEFEMEALAEGAQRALAGEEPTKNYE